MKDGLGPSQSAHTLKLVSTPGVKNCGRPSIRVNVEFVTELELCKFENSRAWQGMAGEASYAVYHVGGVCVPCWWLSNWGC